MSEEELNKAEKRKWRIVNFVSDRSYNLGYNTGIKEYKEALKKEIQRTFPNSYLTERLTDIIDTVQPTEK